MLKSQEILETIENLKNEVKGLQNEGKLDDAVAKLKEIADKKKEFEVQKSIEDMEKEDIEDKVKTKKGADDMKNKKNIGEIMAKAIVGNATPEELAEIKNLMVEGDKAKGGITVPQDVSTKIIEFQRNSFDMRKYINVEPVSTNKGSRPIMANEPQKTGFASVDEGKEIQALYEPEFTDLSYTIRKYAGYLPLTNELLDDSAESILNFVERWMAKNELNTYNYQVLNGTGDKSVEGIMTSDKVKKIDGVLPSIDDIKNIINVELEDLDSDSIKIFTNAIGFQHLDTLKDQNGNYLLQPDVTKASGYSLLGKEVVKVPSKFLANSTDAKVPFIIGDLTMLFTMFDRKLMSIESTNIGGTAWREDKTEVKGIFRFDGRIIDKEAAVILLASQSTETTKKATK